MILSMELDLMTLKVCPAGCEDLQADQETFHTCKMSEFKKLLKGSLHFPWSVSCLIFTRMPNYPAPELILIVP